MKTVKRLFSLVMTIILSIGVSFSVGAESVKRANDTTDIVLKVPVVSFENELEFQKALERNQGICKLGITPYSGAMNIYAGVIRNGNTTNCEFVLSWSGTDILSGIRFKKIVVRSTSGIFRETYATFGEEPYTKYTTKYVPATATGSIVLDNFNLDSDITMVEIRGTDVQWREVITSEWNSCRSITAAVPVN